MSELYKRAFPKSKFLLLYLFLPVFSFANNTNDSGLIVAKGKDLNISVGNRMALFVDKKGVYSDLQVTENANFTYSKKEIPSLAVTPGNIWGEFSIVNLNPDPNIYLELEYTNLSKLLLYRKVSGHALEVIDSAGNGFLNTGLTEYQKDFVFHLHLPQNDTVKYYFKINSKHPIFLPLFVKDASKILQISNNKNLFFGLYFGVILSLLLYNMFLLISTRDMSYFFYVIYLFFLGLAQLTVSGYGFKYLWSGFTQVNQYALVISSALASITGSLFAIFFLRIAYYYRKFIFIFSLVIISFVLAIICTILNLNHFSYTLINFGNLFGGPLLLIISILIARKGYKPAVNYLVAWSFLLAGIIVFALRNFGIIPYTTLTTYSLYIGSAIEAIFLSTALADRINSLRKEKEESQVYALKISRENETLIKEQNIVLEQKVTERTNELVTTNNQLNQTLDELKDAQTQLVEAEKMASLGQLTAGIAHEINNPINFVKSNIKPLNLDIDDIFEVVDMYNGLHSAKAESITPQLKKISSRQDELDMDFVKQEIRQLIRGIEDGAERTAEIVRGLRTFSRLDESELKVANMHDGLSSTLILLRNSMPAYFRVEKKFNAKGDIECFPGKLNQVFMNIINNSIQAIEEKKEKNAEEWIVISTQDIPGNKIQIRIKDTGIGMNEQVKHKIFEPFFTTKSVGVGTGLGMAIVFRIIEEHHGKIEVESEPGKGAEFILTLPYIHPGA